MHITIACIAIYLPLFSSYTAVDEQNAQTEQQREFLHGSTGIGSMQNILSGNERGLAADIETSRSAPSFSVFTADNKLLPLFSLTRPG